jgi:uncharacterized protein
MAEWLKARGENILISVRVQPGASKNSVTGIKEDFLNIKLCSPPLDGRANDSLISFVAKALDVSRSSIQIIQGIKNRKKLLEISGVTMADAEKAFIPLL